LINTVIHFTNIGSRSELLTHPIQPHLCYLIGMQPSFSKKLVLIC